MLYLANQVLAIFLHFEAFVERQFLTKIKMLQSNGGTELKKMESHLLTNGIVRQLTFPYTPSQNGVIERCNR